jgi:L-ascorbate oxidase
MASVRDSRFTDDGGVQSYIGGKWFFTVNGQVHPTIHAGPKGEIWRITQASGSRTYQLAIEDDVSHRPLVFQVLALDGVTVTSADGMEAFAHATGGKVRPVACPASMRGVSSAICADALHLMPSSRAEIWIPPMTRRTSAELVTGPYNTGPAGDDWPSARLAHVEFPLGTFNETSPRAMKVTPGRMLEAAGLLNSEVKIDGGARTGEIALQAGACRRGRTSSR